MAPTRSTRRSRSTSALGRTGTRRRASRAPRRRAAGPEAPYGLGTIRFSAERRCRRARSPGSSRPARRRPAPRDAAGTVDREDRRTGQLRPRPRPRAFPARPQQARTLVLSRRRDRRDAAGSAYTRQVQEQSSVSSAARRAPARPSRPRPGCRRSRSRWNCCGVVEHGHCGGCVAGRPGRPRGHQDAFRSTPVPVPLDRARRAPRRRTRRGRAGRDSPRTTTPSLAEP